MKKIMISIAAMLSMFIFHTHALANAAVSAAVTLNPNAQYTATKEKEAAENTKTQPIDNSVVNYHITVNKDTAFTVESIMDKKSVYTSELAQQNLIVYGCAQYEKDFNQTYSRKIKVSLTPVEKNPEGIKTDITFSYSKTTFDSKQKYVTVVGNIRCETLIPIVNYSETRDIKIISHKEPVTFTIDDINLTLTLQ